MKITDELLYQHAAEARDIWLDTIPEDSEIPEHPFSEEFIKEMDVLASKSHQKRRRPFRRFQQVAAVFAVVLIGAGSWFAADAEARSSFVQWIRMVAPAKVMYHFVGETPKTVIPNFRCTWLPDGVEVEETSNRDAEGDVIYRADDDRYSILSYYYMHEGVAHFLFPSGEELIHETVEINGMPGDYYEETEEGHSSDLFWFDEEAGIAFNIHSLLSREEIFRMAESVQEGTPLEYMPEYELTWLPEGYRSRELSRGSHARLISGLNKDGENVRLEYEILRADTLAEHFYLDEYTEVKSVTVWDEPAELYLNTDDDGTASLLWYEASSNIAFNLESTEDEETMLRIAEAIEQK